MTSDYFCSRRPSIFVALIFIMYLGQFKGAWAQETAEQNYNVNCGICHTIGAGRLIGPDLEGIHDRRSQTWLEQFVKSSTSMINSGDADAVALFEEYNKMLMPDPPFTEEQIKEILNYIKTASTTAASPIIDNEDQVTLERQAVVEVQESVASQEDILLGQDLFQGITRFENGGPTCNACHDVMNDAVIGGGILAAELTTVFSRMGGRGVTAILGQSPFPVMQAAYEDKALTEDEIFALVAFLQKADEDHQFQQPRDYGIGLFVSGIVGAVVLFLLFGFLWRGRKIGSVYQDIFDRQQASE
jgi:cytochrome c2